MTEKKEVIDYLRNRQKAAEIEAKVNGINLWVLLGAMAVVGWQMLGTLEAPVWRRQELVIRALVVAQCAYLALWVLGARVRRQDQIRFASWRLQEMETPFLDLLQGCAFLTPLVLLLVWYRDLSALVPGLVGLVALLSGISGLIGLLGGANPEAERFPKPHFVGGHRSDAVFSVIYSGGLAWVIARQFDLARPLIPEPLGDSAKVLGSIVVFYLLCLLAIQRRAFSHGTRWTYELETDLLLDAVTAEVALRRIEHRALGPRLQDVMDKFFDALDQCFAKIESIREECFSKLNSLSGIPKEYETERGARAKAATAPMLQHLDDIERDCKEFGAYLQRIRQTRALGKGSVLGTQLDSVKSRLASYVARADSVREEVRAAISDAMEQ